MRSKKLEILLKSHNSNYNQLSNLKKINRQNLYRRKKSDFFSIDDLIEIGMLTDTQLAFINKDKEVVISFDESDLTEKELNSLNMDYLKKIKKKHLAKQLRNDAF